MIKTLNDRLYCLDLLVNTLLKWRGVEQLIHQQTAENLLRETINRLVQSGCTQQTKIFVIHIFLVLCTHVKFAHNGEFI